MSKSDDKFKREKKWSSKILIWWIFILKII
jgi:hypothetical protein